MSETPPPDAAAEQTEAAPPEAGAADKKQVDHRRSRSWAAGNMFKMSWGGKKVKELETAGTTSPGGVSPSRRGFFSRNRNPSPDRDGVPGESRASPQPQERTTSSQAAVSGSSLLAQLNKDVDAIRKDTTKKQPALQEALQAAQGFFDEMSQSSAANDNVLIAEALRGCPHVVHLAVTAAEHKNSKVIVLGLNLLQKLASFNAVSSDQFEAVGKVFRSAAENSDDAVVLRVVQAISAAGSSEQLAPKLEASMAMLETLLVVQGSKTVSSPIAEAVLRQVTNALLDMAASATRVPPTVEEAAAAAIRGGEARRQLLPAVERADGAQKAEKAKAETGSGGSHGGSDAAGAESGGKEEEGAQAAEATAGGGGAQEKEEEEGGEEGGGEEEGGKEEEGAGAEEKEGKAEGEEGTGKAEEGEQEQEQEQEGGGEGAKAEGKETPGKAQEGGGEGDSGGKSVSGSVEAGETQASGAETAESAMRAQRQHVVSEVYDYDKHRGQGTAEPEAVLTASRVLQEVATVAYGGGSSLRFKNPEGKRWLCLDVLNSALRTHTWLFQSSSVLEAQLQDEVCPMLISQLQAWIAHPLRSAQAPGGFPLLLQLMRMAAVIISRFPAEPKPTVGAWYLRSEGSSLLPDIANILSLMCYMATSATAPPWLRLLAMETLHEYMSHKGFAARLQRVFIICRGEGEDINVLTTVSEALEKVLARYLEPEAAAAAAAAARAAEQKRGVFSSSAPKNQAPAPPALPNSRQVSFGGAGAGDGAEAAANGAAAAEPEQVVTVVEGSSVMLPDGGQRARLLDSRDQSVLGGAADPQLEEAQLELALLSSGLLIQAIGELCGVTATSGLGIGRESMGEANGAGARGKPKLNARQHEANSADCLDMMENIWKRLLAILKMLLRSVRAPPLLGEVLRASAVLLQTCVVLQLVHVRDQAFKLLSENILPPTGVVEMGSLLQGHKLLQCKALVAVVFELASVMAEAWVAVLPVFQRLQTALAERGFSSVQSRVLVNYKRSVMSPVGGFTASNPLSPRALLNGSDKSPATSARRLSAGVVSPGPGTPKRTSTAGSRRISAPEALEGAASAAEEAPELGRSVSEQTPGTVSGNAAAQAQADEAELEALRDNLDRLFEETSRLSDEAVVGMLSALRRVSLDSQSDSKLGGVEGGVSFVERMFGVDKTVAITRHNLHRLEALWGTVTAHLYQIATHPRPAMRQHGMQAYAALIVDGFRYTYGTGGAQRPEGKKEDASAVERLLMGAYENLFTCPYGDTKSYVLDGMHQLLEECGKHIGGAWPSMLAQLKSVPLESEGPQIKQVHACVKTITDTLMDDVPVDCIQLLLTALGALGQQDTEIEASLDAVGMLRGTTKFLRTRRQVIVDAMQELGKGPGRDSGEAACRQLWVCAIGELLALAVDRRNRVRDAAVATLFEVLGQAAEEYGEAMVVLVMLRQVLPGLEGVGQRAQEASQQGALNTAQWLTTWSQLMAGAASLLLRSLVPALVSGTVKEELETEEGGDGQGEGELMARLWKRFLELYGGAKELQDDKALLESVATVAKLMVECPVPASCWASYWDANERLVSGCSADGVVGSKTLLEVVKQLVSLQASGRVRELGVVTQEAVAGQLRALGELMTRQRKGGDRGGGGHAAGQESAGELQEALNRGFRALAASFALMDSEGELALWREAAAMLLAHLPAPESSTAWAQPGEALPEAKAPQVRAPQLAVWLLLQIYREASERVRGLLFEAVALRLLDTMASRTQGQPKHVWQCAADGFGSAIEAGLAPMCDAAELATVDKNAAWKRILEGMRAFLVPEQSEGLATVAVVRGDMMGGVARWRQPEWEDSDVAVARTLAVKMLPMATAEEIQSQAVLLLDGVVGDGCQGSYSEDVGRAVLTGTCLDGLMAAAANWGHGGSDAVEGDGADDPQLFLAKSAATVAVERCREVVERYLDGEEAPENRGKGPAATRAELAVSALSMLETLELQPPVFEYLCAKLSDGDAAKALTSVRPKNTLKDRRERIAQMVGKGGKRGHMVLLVSTLCRCITSKEEELRQGARRMLQSAAQDIGIAEFV